MTLAVAEKFSPTSASGFLLPLDVLATVILSLSAVSPSLAACRPP